MSQLGSSGWGGLNNIEARMEQEMKARGELATTIAGLALETFSTPAGRDFLAYLKRITVERSEMPHLVRENLIAPPDGLLNYVIWRSAENELVRQIDLMMRSAEQAAAVRQQEATERT